ncbi:MAG: SDR family oxidoreductase [Fibrobacteria bacterium]
MQTNLANNSARTRLLEGKNAIIYAAAGAVGRTIAHAFAREGARVFLTGRNAASVEALAREISAEGGMAEAARVDALDEAQVDAHFALAVKSAGAIEISFNAIGIPQEGIQGIPLTAIALASYCLPIETYAKSHFITSRAAARHMELRGRGAILLHTPEPARAGVPLVGGMGPAWASLEGLVRFFSAELASKGVRVVCLRTTGMLETATIDTVFGLHAKGHGISYEQFRSGVEARTHRQRSTTLRELADAAVFAASDRAGALTGGVLNLTGGAVAD